MFGNVGMYGAWITLVILVFVTRCISAKLLLILMDGFRWDYLFQPGLQLPGFHKLFQEGVGAEYIIPDFPTLSYPNYYSLMTGLHAENHGMVSNHMYSVKHNETFMMGSNPEQYHAHWWNDAEPLWVTAEKNGKISYFYFWPGCEVAIKGIKPTFCENYKLAMVHDFQFAIESTIQLLKDDKADLIGIYLEAIDNHGHLYGAKSDKINRVLTEIDIELSNLLEKLKSENLENDLNIMIFSDHGMANVTGIVDFRNAINYDDIHYIMPEPTLISIWPKDGKTEKVYKELIVLQKAHTTIYKKEDIPERYHFKKHRLVAPIIIVPDVGFLMCTFTSIQFISIIWFFSLEKNEVACSEGGLQKYRGYHGYDNEHSDMRGIFIAKGPAFKKNHVSKPMANVQIYQIMCDTLGITAQPHNGTWETVQDMMTSYFTTGNLSFSLILFFILNTILVILIINNHILA